MLVPNSAGWPEPDAVQEHNPCHDIGDGRFATKGQGRCLGDASRRAARADDARLRRNIDAAWNEKMAVDAEARFKAWGFTSDPTGVAERRRKEEVGWRRARRVTVEEIATLRKEALAAAKKHPVPAFMQQDVQRARRTDRAILLYQKDPADKIASPASANTIHRTVYLQPTGADDPRPFRTKTEQLTVLRHELGHIDRTPLGRGGQRFHGLKVSPLHMEEMRAWKNAVRNSRGRLDWKVVQSALLSYNGKTFGGMNTPKAVAATHKDVTLLKRYAKRVRRASKGLH